MLKYLATKHFELKNHKRAHKTDGVSSNKVVLCRAESFFIEEIFYLNHGLSHSFLRSGTQFFRIKLESLRSLKSHLILFHFLLPTKFSIILSRHNFDECQLLRHSCNHHLIARIISAKAIHNVTQFTINVDRCQFCSRLLSPTPTTQ